MKKRVFGVLLTGIFISIFMTGCRDAGKTESKDIQDEEYHETENAYPENAFSGTVTRENLGYYYYSNGSSSLLEEYMIYPYEDEFIFAANYFNCGQGLMETYSLTEEQVEGVLEEVNAVSLAGDTSAAGEEKSGSDGESQVNGSMMIGEDCYQVGKIDFDKIGIEVKDASDVAYPSEDPENALFIDGFEELQESDQWKKTMLSNGIPVFGEAVREQAETELGVVIDSMIISELGTEELTVKLHTNEDEVYTAVVTYRGYVAYIEKE